MSPHARLFITSVKTTGSVFSGTTGVDPGRNGVIDGYIGGGGDDIDLHDHALQAMIDGNVQLLAIHSGAPDELCGWETWAESTGGLAVQIDPDGSVPCTPDPPSGASVPEAEPNDTAGTANALAIGADLTADISPAADEDYRLAALLVDVGLAASRGAAKRLITGGGVSVDGAKAESIDAAVPRRGTVLLRAGKRQYARIVFE